MNASILKTNKFCVTEFDFHVAFEPDDFGGRFGVADHTLKDNFFIFSGLNAGSGLVIDNFDGSRWNLKSRQAKKSFQCLLEKGESVQLSTIIMSMKTG